MKKLIVFTICVFLLTITFASCFKEDNSSDQSQDNSNDISQENSDDNSQQPTKTAADLTTEELEEILFNKPSSDVLKELIFNPADSLYCLFDGLCDIGYEQDNYIEENGNCYYLVTDSDFPTYQSFVNRLHAYFSDKIAKNLLATEKFKEIDGVFYAQVGVRGCDYWLYDRNYSISYISEEKIVFSVVTIHFYEEDLEEDLSNLMEVIETNVFDYEYIKTDGKWAFNTYILLN